MEVIPVDHLVETIKVSEEPSLQPSIYVHACNKHTHTNNEQLMCDVKDT